MRALTLGGLLLASAAVTTGCGPLVVGGTIAGVAVAGSEERGLGGYVSDTELQARINKLWFDHSVDMLHRLNMTVDSGRVLLFGKAKDPQQRLDAVRLAWQARGVKEVINEIQVDEGTTSLVTDAKDSWITTQVRTRITFNFSISSQNYSIDTLEGVVYLMGVAKSPAEMNAVVEQARAVPGVLRVVNYVRLIERPAGSGAGAVPTSGGTGTQGSTGTGNGSDGVTAAPAPRRPTIEVEGDGATNVPGTGAGNGPMRLR